jgi:hypothetical protein
MSEQVLTGALAIVSVRGVKIGKMKNITVTENLGRGRVNGLGTIYTVEAPVLSHQGSFTCEFYMIDWEKAKFQGSQRRDAQTKQEYEDYLVLQEEGFQLDIFKKISQGVDDRGFPIVGAKPLAVLTGCFSENESFNITEGQVSGHNQSFIYLNPVLYPK